MNRKILPGNLPETSRLRALEHAITHAEEVFVVSAVNLEDGAAASAPSVESAHTHVDYDVPTGSGAAWTLTASPLVGSDQVVLNGIQLRRVASSPTPGEYSISGAAVTLGAAIGGSDRLWAHYLTAVSSTHAHREYGTLAPLGGAAYQLSEVPLVGSDHVYLSGVQLRRVASAPGLGEYTISGDTVTLGFTPDGGTHLWAHYRV